MIRYILSRMISTAPTVFAVLTLVFILVRLVPGDPALVIMGDQAKPEALAALRERLGIDVPIWRQYLAFLWQMLNGDLGRSLITNRSVLETIAGVLPYTLELTIAAVIIGLVFGVPLGIAAAYRRDGFIDWLARIVSLTGLSFPAFISAILMLLAFAIHLSWFPVISLGKPLSDPVGRLQSLALPAINLGIVMMAYVTRVTRSGMIKVMEEEYIRTAQAKGLTERSIVFRHGLRNILVPLITFSGLYFSVLIGNSVLTEIVFNRPGLGKLIVGALEKRDYTMLQGLIVIYAIIVVIINLITDLAYGLADPRVKAQ